MERRDESARRGHRGAGVGVKPTLISTSATMNDNSINAYQVLRSVDYNTLSGDVKSSWHSYLFIPERSLYLGNIALSSLVLTAIALGLKMKPRVCTKHGTTQKQHTNETNKTEGTTRLFFSRGPVKIF